MGGIVIGRQYFLRQAATLLESAQLATDPQLSAELTRQAANLITLVEGLSTRGLPDVEPLRETGLNCRLYRSARLI